MKKTETISPEFSDNDFYQILSVQSGKAIEASDGTDAVYMNTPSSNAKQQFHFAAAKDGTCQIICRQTGRVIDVILAGTQNGAQIHQWDSTGADNQLWLLEPAEDDTYIIRAKSSKRCLDVVGMAADDGARIQIWEYLKGDNQKWKFNKVK